MLLFGNNSFDVVYLNAKVIVYVYATQTYTFNYVTKDLQRFYDQCNQNSA